MPSTFTSRLEGLTTSVAVKAPCRVATTAAITLSGLQTIDSVALSAGDRVLVKNQSSAIDNGIWIASVGAWTRAADFDGTLDAVGGTQVMVIAGPTNANTYWRVDGDGEVDIGQHGVTFEVALVSDSATQTFLQSGIDAEPRSVQDKLREFVSVADYRVSANGATDDRAAIVAAIAAADGRPVYFPEGTYLVGSAIDLTGYAGGVQLWGDGPEKSKIVVNGDVNLFTHGPSLKVRDLGFLQLGTSGLGRAFSTTSTGEASYCVFERCDFYDFKFGILHRKSLWATYRDLGFFDCKAGIRLARSDSFTDQTNPNAPSGWNTGWYNNQITFERITIDGGEVGIMAAGMGMHFDNVTCQGMLGTGSGNVVLPSGEVGTGIWLDGGQTSDMSWNNVITNYYAENTRRPLRLADQRHVLIDGAFVQGLGSGTPLKYALHLINATATVRGITGQDYFENMAKLESASVLYGRLPGFGTVSNYVADSTSSYYINEGRLESYLPHYEISKPNGDTSASWTLPSALDNFGAALVTINALIDGTTKSDVTYLLHRWNSQSLTTKQILSGTETHYTLSISGNQVVIASTITESLSGHVHLMKLGDIAGQTVAVAQS